MEVQERITESENLLRKGRFAEAIALLHDVLADDPTDLKAVLNVGIAYTEYGENDKAIKALDFYTAREQNSAEAWEALGCAYLRKGEYTSAEEYLLRAQGLAPDNASILRNLSVLLSRTDRGDRSLSLLERAHELDGSDYLTTYALAIAYRSTGDTEKARSHFHEITAFFPELPAGLREDVEQQLLELSLGW
jgi:Flp pilus assembly protein TadD